MSPGTEQRVRGVLRSLWPCLLLVAAPALAQRSAQQEVDEQLRELLGSPPTRVKVTFQAFYEPGYALEELELTLDGVRLPTPPAATLTADGDQVLYEGAAKAGDHRLEARAVIADKAGLMMSNEPGYKWKVALARTFNLTPGLEVAVALAAVRVPEQRDPRQKFKLTSTATPRMLVALDDGKMPEPVARRPAQVPDAGPSPEELAALEKQRQAEEARAAKLAAADEKKRQAEEAKAAKLAAAEEKKRQAEEARAAKLAAALETKRQAEEARAAKVAAALETKRQAEEAKAANVAAAARPIDPEEDAIVLPKDAGAGLDEAAAAVDAGPVLVAQAPEPRKADAPLAPPAEPETSWAWWVAGGVVALGVVLFLLARRRANPRDPGV